MTNLLLVLTTVPDGDVGGSIGTRVVEEGLVPCVNLIPAVRSIYRWEGAICDEGEALMIAKVRADRFDEYERRVTELHPYDVPEVVAIAAERVSEAYLRWALGEPPDKGVPGAESAPGASA